MKRLTHSPQAIIRSMQISKQKFFAYVEGGLDRTFYDRMLRQRAFKLTEQFEIRAARELPGSTGGKLALIAHFKELKRRNALAGQEFGKSYTTAFLFDKDIDDIMRKQLRSPHAIYTETYDLEGHLFDCGDMHAALADAAHLTYEQAVQVLGPRDGFFSTLVESWSDWISLCVISQVLKVNVGCTYDSASRLNSEDGINLALRDEYLSRIALKANLPLAKVEAKFIRYKRLVIKTARSGQPFKYFRGKWMRVVFQDVLSKKIIVPDATLGALADRTITALLAQVGRKEECECCTRLHRAMLPLSQSLH